jgi:YegS/Rv2252/BmrU family lipid kinase
VNVAAFHVAEDHDELASRVRSAGKHGAPVVIAGGGDGTMAYAVDALAYRKTALGVLPLGTGNSFAQSLGLDPHDLDAAVAVIARGHTAKIDLGRVHGRYFANFATIGISSEIAGATPAPVKRWSGTLAYAAAAIRPLLTHRAFRARIGWKRGRLDLRTQDIIVANGRFFGTTPLTPDASLVNGRLALFTNEGRSGLDAMRTYLALGMRAQAGLPHAHTITAKSFTIETSGKQSISLDGSVVGKTPARFRVAREALRVFVPEDGVARG